MTSWGYQPENKLHNLGVGDEPLPVGASPDGTQEVVEVHEHMYERVSEQRNLLQRLLVCQPEVGHGQHRGVVEDM